MDHVVIFPKTYPTNLLQKDWTQRRCFYRKEAIELMPLIHDMKVLEDDIWLVTLPKCGTTWMQELLWLVINDYDFETAKREHLELRTPFLEYDFFLNENLETALKPVENLKSPRLIKSHLPLPLLPAQLWSKKPKTIYVYRHPIDAIVSRFYHSRNLGQDMEKSCEQYVNEYIEKVALKHRPFEHVHEFYQLRHEPWVLYVSFECMKLNLREVIVDVCAFLGKTITDQQMEQMLEHLSFESMKVNPKVNHHWEFEQEGMMNKLQLESHNFVRKGKIGGYKDDLSPEFIKNCNKWIVDSLGPYNLTLSDLLLLDNDSVQFLLN